MRSQKRLLTAIVGLALAVVLMIPAISQAQVVCQRVDSFEILSDLSGSMGKGWKGGDCSEMDKFKAKQELLTRINEAIPNINYNGALRIFGEKFYISGPEDISRLIFGPGAYSKADMGAAIAAAKKTQGITPLGPAILASNGEFAAWAGPKALLILSDFQRSPGFGQPVDEAKKLKEAYGNDIYIHTIIFDGQETEIATAQAIAAAGGGNFYDGCTLLKDQAAFDKMMLEVFCIGCADDDGDGVCNDDDKCPATPKGVDVDERGCWIIAFDSFFDFDKAIVKPEFMPALREAADIMKQYPEMYVTLEGNTDSVGSEQYNYGLGLRRAKAVEKVLVNYGVKAGRMRAKSYGETRPIATNETEEGRAQNRRVEVQVLEAGALN